MVESKYLKKDIGMGVSYDFSEMKAALRAIVKRLAITDEEIEAEK